MSKERARLRAEREEHAHAERAKRAAEAEKRAKRAGDKRRSVDAPKNRAGKDVGSVEVRRRQRFRVAVVIFVLVQVAVFFLTDAWNIPVTALLLSLLFTPAILMFMNNRRY